MASHGDDRAGSMVHRLPPSGQKKSRLLLLHREQCLVGRLGLASRGLGPDHPAVLPLRHEFARLAKEHTTRGMRLTVLAELTLSGSISSGTRRRQRDD